MALLTVPSERAEERVDGAEATLQEALQEIKTWKANWQRGNPNVEGWSDYLKLEEAAEQCRVTLPGYQNNLKAAFILKITLEILH